MADPVASNRPDDGLLVAYIDGALDPAERATLEAQIERDADLARRVDMLRRGGRPFAEAYEPLLAAAPREKLDAILTDVVGARARPARRRWRPAAIAAALAIFVVGAAAGYMMPRIFAPPPQVIAEAPNWRQAVAEYVTLMTSDTLTVIPNSPAVLTDAVAAVGDKISIALTPDKLALPHVYLKQAQLFDFHGKPLAQLAYLSRADGPIAFCIIVNGQPDAPPAFEQREGSNIVFWTRDGRGFMLIGKAPRATLETLAGDLASRIS